MVKKGEVKKAGLKDYVILQSPIVTEKASIVGGTKTRVVFRVDVKATKTEIKEAVQKAFNVEVESVNTVNYLGKVKRTTGFEGRRANFKKAYVSLKEGQTIQIVEGI